MKSEGKCRKCYTPIYWIKTKAGKDMPANTKLITIITETGEVSRGYESHFSSCPYANEFRRKT